jgi:serine/threonine-protein kinase RsbW
MEWDSVASTEGTPSPAAPAVDPTETNQTDAAVRDVVTVRLPAAAAYLAVVRTTTASLAAYLNFTLDEIEDMRIAVDEASCLVLAGATDDAELTCVFEMFADSMQVSISVMTNRGHSPARDSFAWTVLTALAGQVDAWTEPDGRQTISLVKRRAWDAST